MPSVLITRPQASSEHLAVELRRRGYQCVLEPMLSVSATDIAPPNFHDIKAVMITSANAVDFIKNNYKPLLKDLPCFCVGPRTAEKARHFGFMQIFNSHKDGIELADMIKQNLPNKNDKILHVAGRNIDSRAHHELARIGYTVTPWTVYKADASDRMSDFTQNLIKQQILDAVLFFSMRSAETFKNLLKQHQVEACCESLIAIGLSEAIADNLKVLPWQKCIATAIPTEEAVIALLTETVPVS